MSFDSEFFNIGYLDTLAYRDTLVHRIDARTKLFVTGLFIISVVSFPAHELAGLVPYFIYPVFLLAAGDIPLKAILKKVLLVSPFVIFVGIFNPLFDRHVVMSLGGIDISGGWVSFASIMLKFVLTVSSALLLIATTSFVGICEGLGRMKVPDVFVTQLLFLYRYLFVLLEEAFRMVRAREARSFGRKGYGVKPFISLISVLMVRTFQRAERVYGAMVSRGFSGKITLHRTGRIGASDLAFGTVFTVLFLLLRYYDITGAVGRIVTGGVR